MATARSNNPADWYVDPDNQEAVRWWDGAAWTEQRQPRLLFMLDQQLDLSRRNLRAVESIRGMLTFFTLLAIVGLVLAIASVADAFN